MVSVWSSRTASAPLLFLCHSVREQKEKVVESGAAFVKSSFLVPSLSQQINNSDNNDEAENDVSENPHIQSVFLDD